MVTTPGQRKELNVDSYILSNKECCSKERRCWEVFISHPSWFPGVCWKTFPTSHETSWLRPMWPGIHPSPQAASRNHHLWVCPGHPDSSQGPCRSGKERESGSSWQFLRSPCPEGCKAGFCHHHLFSFQRSAVSRDQWLGTQAKGKLSDSYESC